MHTYPHSHMYSIYINGVIVSDVKQPFHWVADH